MAVYDDEKKESLKAGNKNSDAVKKSLNPSELKNAEGSLYSGSDSSKTGLFNSSKESAGSSSKGLKGFLWGSRNRKLATGGIGAAGGVTGIVVTLFFIAAGPAQLVQLSEVLQKNFRPMDEASNSRLSQEVEYATSALQGAPSSLGATRLGNLTQLYLKPILNNLKNAGIDPVLNKTAGLSAYEIDPEAYAAKNSEFGDSPEEQKAWLEDQFGDFDGIEVSTNSAGHFVISDPEHPVELPRASVRLVNDVVAKNLLDNDSIVGALNSRVLSKYYGATSLLFHPLSTLAENARRKITEKTTPTELKDEEEADEEASVDPLVTPEETTGNLAGLKGTLTGAFQSTAGKAVANLLTGTAIYCELKGQVNNIVDFNRVAIVLPAAVEATRFIAIGDQIKSGQDVSASQVGEVVDTLTDSQGQSIWNAKALQAEENSLNPSGPDIDSGYYEAFSGTASADTINAELGAHGINNVVCSAPAQIIQGLVGIAALLSPIFTDGASGPATAALIAARLGDSAIIGGALYYVIHDLTGLLKDNSVVTVVLSGKEGGNLAD